MTADEPVIILTRPAAQNAEFAEALEANGVVSEIIQAPVTRIIPVPFKPLAEDLTGAIFTSRNGVEYAPSGNKIAWCVGDKTAEFAEAKGWRALSAQGDAEALIQRICADLAGQEPGQSLRHYCGLETRGSIAERLSNAGISTQRCVVYKQEAQSLTSEALAAISVSKKVIFPVFSPRSAQRLASQLPPNRRWRFVVISKATADALPPEVIDEISTAKSPDAQSLIAALRHML